MRILFWPCSQLYSYFQNNDLSDYSCLGQVGLYKTIFLVSSIKRSFTLLEKLNLLAISMKKKTAVDVADNNSLESLEAYNNTASRLSNKFSFEKYKNNPEM